MDQTALDIIWTNATKNTYLALEWNTKESR